MRISDWSSDVCSSDLRGRPLASRGSPGVSAVSSVETLPHTHTAGIIMRKVFIIGGSGKVARRLAQQLAARGHEPRALYRKAEQADGLEALGAVPVQGDLLELDADGLARRMAGSDIVVFSAGAGGKGGDRKSTRLNSSH